MKVCSLYGEGFYYIPGTQTCMKIGGFVRAEIKYDAIGSFEPAINGANAQFFRGGDQIDTRIRTGISLDAREQTAYTTQLGNGWSASLGIEDGTFYARPIKDLNAAPPTGVIAGFGTIFPILAAGGPTNSPWNNAGFVVPDIASNIRVDQPWGAAQVMGALHDDRVRYYNAIANGLISGVAHPADAWVGPWAQACE